MAWNEGKITSMTIAAFVIFLFCLGAYYSRSKVVSVVIFLFVWILGFNISDPDFAPSQVEYESSSYGEIGYRFLCLFFNTYNIEFFFFKLVVFGVSLMLLCRFVIRHSEEPAFASALYLICCPLDITQFRNFFAFSILLNAIPLLGNLTKKNLVWFLSILLLAGSIHASMLLFFIPFLFQKDIRCRLNKSKGYLALLLMILFPIIYFAFLFIVDDEVTSRAQVYIEKSTSLFTKMGVVFLCSLIFLVFKKYHRLAKFVRCVPMPSRKTWMIYSPNDFVFTLNIFFLLLTPITMFSITTLRLTRFLLFINVLYMINVVFYSNKGSYINIFIYSLLSLMISWVLHQNTFINDVLMAVLNENLLLW